MAHAYKPLLSVSPLLRHTADALARMGHKDEALQAYADAAKVPGDVELHRAIAQNMVCVRLCMCVCTRAPEA